MSTIGERLRLAIGRHPIAASYSSFAAMIDMPYRTLQNYMRNEREIPASSLEKIHRIGGINSAWLITGEGDMYCYSGMKISTINKIISIFMQKIIEHVFDTENNYFTSSEKREVFSYMMSENILGFHDVVAILTTKENISSFDELSNWIEYLKKSTDVDIYTYVPSPGIRVDDPRLWPDGETWGDSLADAFADDATTPPTSGKVDK